MLKTSRGKITVVVLLFVLLLIIGGFLFFIKDNKSKKPEKKDYGVFLNADDSSLERFKEYDTIVIDAQYFTRKDIGILHENEVTVYTYLNIGSIENFREYYADYEKLALGDYEHWEEEKWMDVSSPDWQKFIGNLARELYEKGVDGFFIDNCDVYYYATTASIFDGLTVPFVAVKLTLYPFPKSIVQ